MQIGQKINSRRNTMRGMTKPKLFVLAGLLCMLFLVFMLAGCNSNADMSFDGPINDNKVTEGGDNNNSQNGDKFAGGTTTSSGGKSTATPSTGYTLSYWTRKVGGVTTKYGSDLSITETSGATYEAVFVADTDVVKVGTLSELITAMSSNANILLTSDIDATSGYTPVSAFGGVLDGNGHKITVNISSSDTNVGGLCVTLTGVIKNLVLDGTVAGIGSSTSQMVGPFASTISGGLISRCENRATVTSGNGTAGGFIAQGSGSTRSSTVYYCVNRGSVTANKVGVILFANGTKENPLVNLVNNENYGAVQTNSVAK